MTGMNYTNIVFSTLTHVQDPTIAGERKPYAYVASNTANKLSIKDDICRHLLVDTTAWKIKRFRPREHDAKAFFKLFHKLIVQLVHVNIY